MSPQAFIIFFCQTGDQDVHGGLGAGPPGPSIPSRQQKFGPDERAAVEATALALRRIRTQNELIAILISMQVP